MTVDIAFVGADGMAADHLEHAAAHPDAEAVGVCATSEESARETGASHGATPYADVAEMYDAEDPDAAVVAVPPYAHPEPERLAADRGVDLLVEKPLALSRETTRTVEEAVTEALDADERDAADE